METRDEIVARLRESPSGAAELSILRRIGARVLQSVTAVELTDELNHERGDEPYLRPPPWMVAYAEDVSFLLDALEAVE